MKNTLIYKMTALLMSSALLMSCSANAGNQKTAPETENTEVNLNIKTMSQSMIEYEDNDYYTDWEGESPNYIKLNRSSAELEGTGAVIKEGIITINSPGTYVVSGVEVPTMPECERPAEFPEDSQMPDETNGATQKTGIPSDTEETEATV